MTRVVVTLLLLALASCGPSRKPTSFKHPRGPVVTTTISLAQQTDLVVHYDVTMSPSEVSQAAAAIGHHVANAQALAHPVSIYLGQTYPPTRGTYHLWVHRARTVGDPFGPTVLGVVRPDGAHLVLGDHELAPDTIRQMIHLFYAPHPQEDVPAGFWPLVADVQRRSLESLKLRRGVP